MLVARRARGGGCGEWHLVLQTLCSAPFSLAYGLWQSRIYILLLGMAKWPSDGGHLNSPVLPGPSMSSNTGGTWRAMDKADSSALHTHLLPATQD